MATKRLSLKYTWLIAILSLVTFAVVSTLTSPTSKGQTMSFSDDFTSYPTNTCWPDGTTEGSWTVSYAGYGCTDVVIDASGTHWWQQRPKAATSPNVSHSALTTGPSLTAPFTLSMSMRTVSQLRTGSAPNPWEVGWVLWNYTDSNHFYALVLKPNGWELTKEDPAYLGAQRFLVTGSSPVFPVGQTYVVSVTMDTTANIVVSVNGIQLVKYQDIKTPYLSGAVGLYNEDSRVRFTHVRLNAVTPIPSPSPTPTPTPTPSPSPTPTPTPSPSPTPSPTPTPTGMRPMPSPLYGVTIDDVSVLSDAIAAAQHSARMLTTRIVFDTTAAVSDYQSAIQQLQPSSYLMGELLDSSENKNISASTEHTRVASYLAAYGNQVDVWEIGNEVNGNWLGPYTDVQTKLVDAYDQVTAAGKRSALTLYYNVGCGDGSSELDPITFTNQYVPASVRDGLNYVLLSYYETQCNNIRPSAATWNSYFQQLHALYPNAQLGFGEVGLPNAVTSGDLTQAENLLKYYYGLSPQINLSYYIGGYFWWYYAEDMLPYTTKPMWPVLNTAIQGY